MLVWCGKESESSKSASVVILAKSGGAVGVVEAMVDGKAAALHRSLLNGTLNVL